MASRVGHPLHQALNYSDDDDADGVDLGGRRDQHVQAGRQEDGATEQLGRRKLCRQESAGNLRHDVAPEEAGVDETDRLRRPVELHVVESLHLDGGDADVAPDAEGDDEADGRQPSLGVALRDVAARTLRVAILVDFSQRGSLQFRELVRHGQLRRVQLLLDRLVNALTGVLEVVLVVGALLSEDPGLVFLDAGDSRLELEPDGSLEVRWTLFMLRPLVDLDLQDDKIHAIVDANLELMYH